MEAAEQPSSTPTGKTATTKSKSKIARQSSTEAPIANLAPSADGRKKASSKPKTKAATLKGDSEFKKFSRINSMIAHPTEDSVAGAPVKKFNRTLTIADSTSASKPKKTTKSALKGSRRSALKADETDDDMLTPTGGRNDGESSAFEDDASSLARKFKASVSLPKTAKPKTKSSSREGSRGADDSVPPSGSEMESEASSARYSRAMTTGAMSSRSKSSASGRATPPSLESAGRNLTTPKDTGLKSSLKKSASSKTGSVPPGLPTGAASDGGINRSPRNAPGSTRGAAGPSGLNKGSRNIPQSQSDSVMQHGGSDGYGMQAGPGGYGMQGVPNMVVGPDGSWIPNPMMANMGAMGPTGMMGGMTPQQQREQQLMIQQAAQAGQEVDISLLPMLPLPSMPQIVQCQRCNQLLEVPQILPPAKKGVQKLRCGKCLRVSRFRENPADPRSSAAADDGDGPPSGPQQPHSQQAMMPGQMGPMGGPGMGMQQSFPSQAGMRPPFNQVMMQHGMGPGMPYGGMNQGPYMGMNQPYGMSPQMMGQQQYGQFPQQMGYSPQGQMGYMGGPGMMGQGMMGQGNPMGFQQGMINQGPPQMQQQQQMPQQPQQHPQMRKSTPNAGGLPSPTVDDSDSGSVVVRRGPRPPAMAGPQGGRQPGPSPQQQQLLPQQFPRSGSTSSRGPGPAQTPGMHRGPGSVESGDSGMSGGSGSTFPMSPMAGGYSTGGSGGQLTYIRRVMVNGEAVPDDLVQMAEERAGPIQPGNYWYDEVAGFWGQMGGPCLGIIPPGVNFGAPMPRGCANGSTSILVNGRELHAKDLERLMKRGLPTAPNNSYRIEINGNVFDEQSGDFLMSLGKLAPSLEARKRGTGMKMPESQPQ